MFDKILAQLSMSDGYLAMLNHQNHESAGLQSGECLDRGPVVVEVCYCDENCLNSVYWFKAGTLDVEPVVTRFTTAPWRWRSLGFGDGECPQPRKP